MATDRVDRGAKPNRSVLLRDAFRARLQRLEIRRLEEREREGYLRYPQRAEESVIWEAEAVWPEE